MKNKVLPSFEAALADVPDGSTIMVPGFGTPGTPRNLMSALFDQGATNLATISNSVNRDIATLVEAGRIRKVYCAFTAPTHPSRDSPFVRMYNNDEIDAELVPQGTLAERIRAAGAGIGAFYTPTSVGTELAEDKEHREINGRMHVLEYRLAGGLRLHSSLARRYVRQFAISPGAAQLQSDHGDGREGDRRGSGA